jgi:hypothetical protein
LPEDKQAVESENLQKDVAKAADDVVQLKNNER